MVKQIQTIKSVTPSQIRNWRACYSDARILELWDGRESLTAREVADLDIPHRDRMWCLLHMMDVASRAAFTGWWAVTYAYSYAYAVNDDERFAARGAANAYAHAAVAYARAATHTAAAQVAYAGYASSPASEDLMELVRFIESNSQQ